MFPVNNISGVKFLPFDACKFSECMVDGYNMDVWLELS